MSNKLKIAAALIGVFAVFLLYRFSNYLHTLAMSGPTLGADISSSLNDTTCSTCDPDHDGLVNAQEIYWGTDPLNPDTDADGIKDGIEADTGHNPLVPGPNDLLGDANLTDQLSELITSGLYAGALNPASDSYNQSLSDIAASITDSGKYVFSQNTDPKTLNLIKSSSQNDLKYLNEITPILESTGSYIADQDKNVEQNLNTIGDKGYTDSILKFYSDQSVLYQNLLEKAEKISVPDDFSISHAKLIDMIGEMQKISDAIAHAKDDPVKASMAFYAFGDIAQMQIYLAQSYGAEIQAAHLDQSSLNSIFQ